MEHSTGVATDTVGIVTCSECGCQIDVEGITPFAEVECPKCSHIEVVPARLGQFLLLDLMGEGGMGGVYRATDESLGRSVAVKVMLASLGDDEEFLTSFRREAQAIARLNHPHIAQIYSFGQEKGQPYIVMELVSGNRLDDLMTKQGPLDQGLVLRTAMEVAQGLQAADEAGLVHGDIKPENILYDEKGQAKLVDFGLASAAHEKSQEQAIWGTPYYIPPEKIRRQKLDARSDMYSLGGTLYHALTGEPPFDGETAVEVVKARLDAPPRPIGEVREDADERLAATIMRMLEVDPARRHPTYGSLIGDLRRCARESKLLDAPKSRKLQRRNLRIAKNKTTHQTSTIAAEAGAERTGAPKIVVHKSSGGAASSPASAQSGSHKIIVRKSGGTMAQFKAQKAAALQKSPEEEAAAQEAAAKRKRKSTRTTFTIITLLVVAAAGTGIGFHRSAEKARKLDLYNLQKAVTAGTNTYQRIDDMLTEMQTTVATATGLVARANADAHRVTGSYPELPPLVAPEPEVPAPVAAETNAPPEAGDAAPAAAEAPAEPEAAPDTEEALAEDGAVGEADVAPMPEDIPVEKPEIHLLAIVAGVAARDLAYLVRTCETNTTPAEIARNQLLQATTQASGEAMRAELETIAARVEGCVAKATPHLESIRESAQACANLRETFDAAEKIRLEQEEQARLAAEQAERERQEREAYEGKVNGEKSQVDAARMQMQSAIQIHDYDSVDPQIRTMQRQFTTPEAREYLAILEARVKALKAMKQIMIERLTDAGFSYGYGERSHARDILKADERGIYVRGAIAPVKWEELTVTDTLKIVEHFLRDTGTRATQKQALAAGAALYCDSFGERGRKKGDSYADVAVNHGMRATKVQELRPEGW